MLNLSPVNFWKIYKLIIWKLASVYVYFLPSSYKMKTDDRRILEKFIFRDLCFNNDVQDILFVGCSKITSWYPTLFNFFFRKNFVTVDPDINMIKYGSKKKHYVAKFEDIGNNNKFRDRFDIIIINGVFGYGINTKKDQIKTINASRFLLKKGGLLNIGFRNKQDNPDLNLSIIDNKMFHKSIIAGLNTPYFQSKNINKHAFVSYLKK